MVRVEFTEKFKKLFSKIKNNLMKEKIIKQIEKIKDKPEVGKPMIFGRKGTRELYIFQYRLSYAYDTNKGIVYLLNLYHKDGQ
jgi:mRNA-degrading endonuclease RelE of RelBE toxin-antitoxin system